MNIETSISTTAPGQTPLYGADLQSILPQRFPFLMLDRIDGYVPWEWARGVKAISSEEPLLLRDDATEWPMPYVIESLGQLAIGLINLSHGTGTPAKVLLGNVSGVAFHNPAPLGGLLNLEIRIDRIIGDQFIASGRADIKDRPVMSMDSIICKFIVGDQTNEN